MLTTSCEILSGVGAKLAAKLAKCGIHSLQDLLFHLPFRYQDRTRITPIRDIRLNDWCVVTGKVINVEIQQGKRKMLKCYVDDNTGVLQLRFFHFNPQQLKAFQAKPSIRAFGEIRGMSNFEMIHPEYQLLDEEATIQQVEESLTPIYSTTQGLTQTRLRQLVKLALVHCQDVLQSLEWMSENKLKELEFLPLYESICLLHNPPPDTSMLALETGTHQALKRLVFDELLAQRLSLQFARAHRCTLFAPSFSAGNELKERLLSALPFKLTSAQFRVGDEIQTDLMQTKPMLRLIQGDVGAGKTIVAALAALQAIASGFQVAFMAPTDLLSEQHANNLEHWFKPLGIICYRLTGRIKGKERQALLTALQDNQCHILIGTHALFQEKVCFARLGLIIIDEQHRFGVEQRLLLQQKGIKEGLAHQLLMTATPIPRTLRMTQLAHLEVSVLDELPPGRTPVVTAVLSQEKRDTILIRLKHALQEGRQVYWVCTLIEDSEKLQCIAATATSDYLKTHLPDFCIGLVHGRMKSQEKEAIMQAFKQGEIHLLVATTVIEVGVDVPNASVMIIENAERLGLSQLHQLRGRVGRGSIESHCLLLYQSPLSYQSAERLRVMRSTNDGFVIAEKDLELRGAGEILGKRQTGYQAYRIAQLERDKALLPHVAHWAKILVDEEPGLAQEIASRWLGSFEQFLQG